MNFFDLFDCCFEGEEGKFLEVGGQWQVVEQAGEALWDFT